MMKVESSSISFLQKPANGIADQLKSEGQSPYSSSRSTGSKKHCSPAMHMDIDKELQRLQRLRSYHVLEEDYDTASLKRLASVATRYFRVPLANIVLVDLERCWSLASTGKDAVSMLMNPQNRETFRWGSIYDEACKDENHPVKFYCVQDLEYDVNLQKMKNTSKLDGYRFFAATPLISFDGRRIGVLSVMDYEPRPMPSVEDAMFLQDIASSMMDLLEQRRSLLLEGVNQSSAGLLRSARLVRACLQEVQEDKDFRSVIGEHEEMMIETAAQNADVMCAAFAAPDNRKNATQKKLVKESICGPNPKKTGMC